MRNNLSLEELVTSQSLVSRRELLTHIKNGRVKVNNEVVDSLHFGIDCSHDVVMVDSQLIEKKYGYMYFKYYKPTNVLCTMDDPQGRPCIGDVVKLMRLPLYPAGRLDRHTTGLLLLTNDGDFSHTVMHPSFSKKKTYSLVLDRPLEKRDLIRLQKGLILADGPVFYSSVLQQKPTELNVVLEEGRNRLVRRSVEHLGYRVKALRRLSIGEVTLSGIQQGEAKELTKKEYTSLIKKEA